MERVSAGIPTPFLIRENAPGREEKRNFALQDLTEKTVD